MESKRIQIYLGKELLLEFVKDTLSASIKLKKDIYVMRKIISKIYAFENLRSINFYTDKLACLRKCIKIWDNERDKWYATYKNFQEMEDVFVYDKYKKSGVVNTSVFIESKTFFIKHLQFFYVFKRRFLKFDFLYWKLKELVNTHDNTYDIKKEL